MSAPSPIPATRVAPAPIREGPGPAWLAPALVALATTALLVLAFAWHPVGDYYAESDFYGGYADGARLILSGRLDPSRYGVVGPVYETALAGVTLLARDPYTAARLLSVAAAAAALGLWFALLRRRFGGVAAAGSVALLAVNPVFVRHGYSATTDMLAVALQAAALYTLLGAAGRRGLLVAGALAALATLTRYSSLYLVPAACVSLWLAPPERGPRGRNTLLFLAGFAAVAVPWIAFAMSRGHVPGEVLVRSFGFYFDPGTSRNVQDALDADLAARPYPSLAEVASRPADVIARLASNFTGHLRDDAASLLGWPAAALAAAGLVAALAPAWRAAALPLAIALASGFLLLLPVFHSARYGLTLAPFYLAFAGLALAAARRAWPRAGAAVAWVAGGAAVLATVATSVAEQRRVHAQLPLEAVAAGRALAADSPVDARVMSRKGHVGYYAGRRVVAFPRRGSIAELAADARQQGAGYLYYSWYEAWLRPEVAWLLDTTAAAPGLAVVYASPAHPAVLYRIGPDFGREPAWFADDFERRLHEARARVAIDPDSVAWAHRIVLGVDALRRGLPERALEMVEVVTRDRPTEALAWVVRAEAERGLGRNQAAVTSYERALALDASDVEARGGLGSALRALGRNDEALRAWRPIVGRTDDRELLAEMAAAFAAAGDDSAAGIARRRIAPTR